MDILAVLGSVTRSICIDEVVAHGTIAALLVIHSLGAMQSVDPIRWALGSYTTHWCE